MIRPPSARIGPVTPDERKAVIAKSPVKGKYDQAVDSRIRLRDAAEARRRDRSAAPRAAGAPAEARRSRAAVLGGIGGMLGAIFGTNRPRGQRLSTGQMIAREITRSVTNRVAGQIAADIGKSIGGSMGSSVGRAIVRGTLGRHSAAVSRPRRATPHDSCVTSR